MKMPNGRCHMRLAIYRRISNAGRKLEFCTYLEIPKEKKFIVRRLRVYVAEYDTNHWKAILDLVRIGVAK